MTRKPCWNKTNINAWRWHTAIMSRGSDTFFSRENVGDGRGVRVVTLPIIEVVWWVSGDVTHSGYICHRFAKHGLLALFI